MLVYQWLAAHFFFKKLAFGDTMPLFFLWIWAAGWLIFVPLSRMAGEKPTNGK